MPEDIEEPVDLRLIDPEWLEREAKKAKKLDDIQKKVNQSRKKLDAGLAPINIPQSSHGTLPKNMAGPKIGAGQYVNPLGLPTGQKPLAAGRAPLSGQSSQQSSRTKFKKEVEDDLLKQLGFSKNFDNLSKEDYAKLVLDPKSFVMGELVSLLQSSAIGSLILFAPEVYEKLVQTIEKEFEAGGLLDIRKFVKDAVVSIPSIQQAIDASSGDVFFTPDAGPLVRQGTPESSNTKAGRNDYMKYIALYRGQ